MRKEGAYLLDRGERVISSEQNQELEGNLKRERRVIERMDVHLFDGVTNADALLQMDREDWREALQNGLIEQINRLTH